MEVKVLTKIWRKWHVCACVCACQSCNRTTIGLTLTYLCYICTHMHAPKHTQEQNLLHN